MFFLGKVWYFGGEGGGGEISMNIKIH